MKTSFRIDLGLPALLEFRGPDAVRFINGQLTQDVKRVIGSECAQPACVTDAKGKLQFRVYLTEKAEQALWISAPAGADEALEVRLTKYLIADDVEVSNLSGRYHLYHLIGAAIPAVGDAFAKKSSRFGVDGVDYWVPAGETVEFPKGLEEASHDELESFRISHGAPAWGSELTEGMLPPEAGLEDTDISYHKGCYIGQEVISRIRTAGKVNRSLLALMIKSDVEVKAGDEIVSEESAVGVLTSVSPIAAGDLRDALGYVKRGSDRGNLYVRAADGVLHEVNMRC